MMIREIRSTINLAYTCKSRDSRDIIKKVIRPGFARAIIPFIGKANELLKEIINSNQTYYKGVPESIPLTLCDKKSGLISNRLSFS